MELTNDKKRTGANKKRELSVLPRHYEGRSNLFTTFSMIILLSVLFTVTAFGQMKIRYGATVGANFAGLYEEKEMSDIKTGLRAGGVVDFGLHKNFSIVTEVLYSQRGWKYFGTGDEEGITRTASLNYVEVPINLTLKIGLGKSTKVTLFPGFYAGYALTAKMKKEEKGAGKATGKIPLGKGVDDFNPLDMGMNLGLGLEVKHVFFKIQLHPGIKNLSNDKNYSSSNSAISLSLGYFIN